jgi:hypothetical protein
MGIGICRNCSIRMRRDSLGLESFIVKPPRVQRSAKGIDDRRFLPLPLVFKHIYKNIIIIFGDANEIDFGVFVPAFRFLA